MGRLYRIQYKYNEPGTLWLVGTFGNEFKVNGTWIGKLKVTDKIEIVTNNPLKVYPNPLQTNTAVGFNLESLEQITVELTNNLGQNIKQIFKGELQKGYNEIYFNNDDLAHGSYYIYVKGQNNKIKFAGKIIK